MIEVKITRMAGTRGYFVGALYIDHRCVRDYDGFARPGETDEDLRQRCLDNLLAELLPVKQVPLSGPLETLQNGKDPR